MAGLHAKCMFTLVRAASLSSSWHISHSHQRRGRGPDSAQLHQHFVLSLLFLLSVTGVVVSSWF